MSSTPHLRIVAVNDVYLLDNLPRLASLIARCREEAPSARLLVTLAGDFVSPSMLSSLDGGRGMVDCLNALGVTHVCFGNHEDDLERPILEQRLREFKGAWLSSNLFGFKTALPQRDIIEVEVLGRAPVRVGLVGVCTLDPALYRGAPFDGAPSIDPEQALREETERLLGDHGCQVVIPLTHLAVAQDRAIARDTGGRYPVIIGGHDHQPILEEVEGTVIVKAGADAFQAAVIDLRWAGIGGRPEVDVRLEDLADYPEAPALRARADGHLEKVRELEAATLFILPEGAELSSVGTRARQTSLGTLFCTRLRRVFEADGCLINGGGIRGATTYRGQFTYGFLKTEMPFDNELVVVPLPGRVLADAIAASRARAPVESGAFLQVDDGLEVDAAHTLRAVGGEPLDPTRTYAIVTMREFFSGMDNIEPLVRFGTEHAGLIPPQGAGRDVKQALVESFIHCLWDQLGGFEGVDADGDGIITRCEIGAAMSRVTGAPPSRVTTDLLMEAFDRNGDGTVTADEG